MKNNTVETRIAFIALSHRTGINSLEIDNKNCNKTFYASFLSRPCISTCCTVPSWFCDDRVVRNTRNISLAAQPDPTCSGNPLEGGGVKRAYKWQEVSSNIYCGTALIIWRATLFTSSVSNRSRPVVWDEMRCVPAAIRFLVHIHVCDELFMSLWTSTTLKRVR